MEFFESIIKVSIIDNGIGFEPLEKKRNLPNNGKLGIIGIEERMRLLGGNLKLISGPDKGTSLFI